MRVLLPFLLLAIALAAKPGKFRYEPLQTPVNNDRAALTDPKLPPVNLHVIAHSHDDVGWLKNVDEYFIGSKMKIQLAGVRYIINGVVDALIRDPSRKFIYVEIAFFVRWWREQTKAKQDAVRKLVKTGQLEFINGGWSMNDEAGTHHSAVVDQMTLGHQFLLQEFGYKPKIGWHIDPFGHASTQASLFSEMGYDAFFINRIDYREQRDRTNNKEMEFVWRNSDNFGSETDIWSHAMYAHYCYFPQMSWDWPDAMDDPVQDDPRLFDYNVEEKVNAIASETRKRLLSIKHNNVLMPFGCDFTFMNPTINFLNMEKVMAYFKAHPEYGINIFYSTPSMYLKAVNQANITWNIKTGDFFPYCDDAHNCWTGYFTSRANLKGYTRDSNNIAHTADRMLAVSNLTGADRSSAFDKIDLLDDAYGIVQHHDAVAGTAKQAVTFDYAKRLSIGEDSAHDVMSKCLASSVLSNSSQVTFSYCPLLNESICSVTEDLSKPVAAVFYNPLGWSISHPARLVSRTPMQVLNTRGEVVPSQSEPIVDRAGYFNTFFKAQLPALGHNTFFLQKAATPAPSPAAKSLENKFFVVSFGADNRVASIQSKADGSKLDISQDYLSYTSSEGNAASGQASGAYIFRPTGPAVSLPGNPQIQIHGGDQVQEAHQTWNSWLSQTIRLFSDSPVIQFESTIKPMDTSNGGRELIFRINSTLDTKTVWYTDSQGQEMIRREKDKRPEWPKFNFDNGGEPESFNYAPMNEAATLGDSKHTISVVTDRSRGCASLANGQFEVMMQRRILRDDGRGVAEPLNEDITVRGSLFLSYSESAKAASVHRTQGLRVNNPPTVAFSQVQNTVQEWSTGKRLTYSALSSALPSNVHLLNLRSLRDGRTILRLHHIFSAGEDQSLSAPATVDLATMFTDMKVKKVIETTLSANQALSEVNKLKWKKTSEQEPKYKFVPLAGTTVTLRPMETRTFVLSF